MKTVLRALGVALVAAVVLSYLTNYDYLWGGIRETWLRGWENAQIDDLPFRDHVRTLPASSNPQPWPEGPLWGKVELDKDGQTWLKNSKTASFLVIQHDSLVYESYLRGHDATTLTNSFSMVKSITAMAVGLAVQQGLVDEQAPVSTYLPRFAEGENASLTVQELLQMRSNIPFGEDYKDPFGFQAKAYYRDDNRTLLEPYRVDAENRERLVPTGRTFVAVDCLGAGEGQFVLITQGSSARMTPETKSLPIDAVIIGLVDAVRVEGREVFSREAADAAAS